MHAGGWEHEEAGRDLRGLFNHQAGPVERYRSEPRGEAEREYQPEVGQALSHGIGGLAS